MMAVIPDLAVLEGRAAAAAMLLKALANERRLRILCRMSTGETSVGHLQAQLGMPQSVLSQHLAGCERKASSARAASPRPFSTESPMQA
jgi:ArsR family transcriptional regulator